VSRTCPVLETARMKGLVYGRQRVTYKDTCGLFAFLAPCSSKVVRVI